MRQHQVRFQQVIHAFGLIGPQRAIGRQVTPAAHQRSQALDGGITQQRHGRLLPLLPQRIQQCVILAEAKTHIPGRTILLTMLQTLDLSLQLAQG